MKNGVHHFIYASISPVTPDKETDNHDIVGVECGEYFVGILIPIFMNLIDGFSLDAQRKFKLM